VYLSVLLYQTALTFISPRKNGDMSADVPSSELCHHHHHHQTYLGRTTIAVRVRAFMLVWSVNNDGVDF
jgi:hypothetical protein